MSRTLNDLIAAAVTGGEEAEVSATPTVEVQTQETEKVASDTNFDDIEKLASALDFLGRQNLGDLFTKEAKAHSSSKTEASKAPEGTNEGQMHAEHVQKQTGPHKDAPPMKPPGFGKIPNNEKERPGMPSPKDGVDTKGQGLGTHHPALASNEAAINYDKKEKAKKVAPALSAVLDNTPFSDPKLKENLSSASGKGDKNIHSKKAHDLAAVKAELQRRELAGRA
jgi:hypothetical protein